MALFCAVRAVFDSRPLEFGENALRHCELLRFSGAYLEIQLQGLLDLSIQESD